MIAGRCWKLLGIAESVLGIAQHFWEFAGSCWELVGIARNLWELLGVAENCWEFLGVAGCW